MEFCIVKSTTFGRHFLDVQVDVQGKKQLCLFLNGLQVGESTPLPAYEKSSERIKIKWFLAQLCELNLWCLSLLQQRKKQNVSEHEKEFFILNIAVILML